MPDSARPLAVVTGASTGIGYELGKDAAPGRPRLLIAADEPAITTAATEFRGLGAHVDAVEADLATVEGVDRLYAADTRPAGGGPARQCRARPGQGLPRPGLR